MTVLVTGATGFVGAAVVRRLLAAGEAVRALVRQDVYDRRNIEGLPVEVALGDLRDRGSLDRALAGCRTLYHLAADYRLWAPRPDELYATNVGVERVVHTSSVATLGVAGGPRDRRRDPRPLASRSGAG